MDVLGATSGEHARVHTIRGLDSPYWGHINIRGRARHVGPRIGPNRTGLGWPRRPKLDSGCVFEVFRAGRWWRYQRGGTILQRRRRALYASRSLRVKCETHRRCGEGRVVTLSRDYPEDQKDGVSGTCDMTAIDLYKLVQSAYLYLYKLIQGHSRRCGQHGCDRTPVKRMLLFGRTGAEPCPSTQIRHIYLLNVCRKDGSNEEWIQSSKTNAVRMAATTQDTESARKLEGNKLDK
jgi:hypothetical protein